MPEKTKTCLREQGDCIEADSIYIECRKYSNWKLFQKSGTHKGSRCKIQKDAKATILKKYTNVNPQ